MPLRLPLPMFVGVGAPGAVGSKVITRFESSIVVHWVADGQDRPGRLSRPLISSMVGLPGAAGSMVATRPPLSTRVHCAVEGQSTAVSPNVAPMVAGDGVPTLVGSKLNS